MTPATTRAFFSAMKVENRSTYVRAYRNNKKDTIGRKCHRRNAKEISFFSQRFSADRETLSRVLQSALVAGQGTHTVQEASHGHSSCARSEDPVWTWSWWTGLARASERKREREWRTDFFWEEDGLLALDCEFRAQRAGLCLSALGIFGISRVCVCNGGLSM